MARTARPAAVYDLAKQIEAATVLKDRFKEAFADDPQAVSDAIEGETSLFEKLEAMLDSIAEDESMVEALKSRKGGISDRQTRLEKRIELKRTLVQTAMQIAEIQKHEFAAATISRGKKAVSANVIDESLLPSKFFEPQPPSLKKGEVNAYVRDRQKLIDEANNLDDPAARIAALVAADQTMPPLPGVEASNGGETFTVRFK